MTPSSLTASAHRKILWRAFLTATGVAALALVLNLSLHLLPEKNGLPPALRTVLDFNGNLWAKLWSPNRLPPVKGAPAGTSPRVNGGVGLDEEVDLEDWRLKILVEDQEVESLSLAQLQWLPRTQTATEFYCIEGWSTSFSYAGVRFSDFVKAFGLKTTYRYVGLETPDKKYYVSIDMESMLHSQTLLAYEMNERPLDDDNGAPLRLLIPIKYGIKSLKRIGTIRFSNQRPPDYWAERGYDWYAGL